MANELFQVRLPDDFAGWIHDYKDDNAMNKSEAIRSLLREGLEAEGYPKDEQRAVADGSGEVVAPLVRTAGAIYAVLGLSLFSALIIGIDIPGFTSSEIFQAAFLSLILTGILMLILYSPLPQWIDWQIAKRRRAITDWISEVKA